MRKMLKNKKGLTLLELLAVMIIIGIIAAIAVPSLLGTINNAKDNADDATITVIEEAAVRYAYDHQLEDNKVIGISVDFAGTLPSGYTDTSDNLVDQGYLNAAPDWQVSSNASKSYVEIDVSAAGGYSASIQ